MLREAVAFPHTRDGSTRDLLLGGVLVLISPLLLPGLLLLGYLLRVMDAAARGRDTAPPLNAWERLLVDGFRGAVVALVWGVLPLLVFVAGSLLWSMFVLPLRLGPTGGSVDTAALTPQQLGVTAAVVGALLVFAVVCWLHLPAALVAVGTQGRLGAGFQTGALWTVVNTRQYVGGVLLAAVVGAVGAVLATLLTPILIGLAVQFYVQIVVSYIVGRAVGGAAVTAIRPT